MDDDGLPIADVPGPRVEGAVQEDHKNRSL